MALPFTACQRSGGTPDSDPMLIGGDGVAKLNELIARSWQEAPTIRFESNDGQRSGASHGLRLTLSRDGSARVDHFGETNEWATGTFLVTDNANLQLDFGADDPWLPMPLTFDGPSIVIHPPDRETILAAASDAGIDAAEVTAEDMAAAFGDWPLRQVRPKPAGASSGAAKETDLPDPDLPAPAEDLPADVHPSAEPIAPPAPSKD